jgi:hypothetical protein
MIGLEQLLMQVVGNGTGTAVEIAGDAFLTSINSLMGSVTALVIAVAGIITAVIAARSNGRTRTKQENQVMGTAESIQLIMQKLQENEARIASIGKATIGLATTEDQRKQLDEQVAPVLNTSRERIEVINAQIAALKAILGVKTADVNTRIDMPRESQETLNIINDALVRAKANL